MRRLIRAALTAAALLVFVNLGSGSIASDRHEVGADHPRVEAVITELMPVPVAGRSAHAFVATAYCQHGVTQSGVNTHQGIVAADPGELPVGSVVQIDTRAHRYAGIYTVLDTGTKVQGRRVDLFMHNCREAEQFGKQPVRLKVLRRGWSPKPR